MRLYLLFLYNKNFLSHHPRFFALFLFYEKKTCTKRKVGWGRRARFIRSDEPGHSPDGPLAGGSRSPLPPPVAVCPGWIKLSHPAFCPNTKKVSCKHLLPPSSRFHYRRALVAYFQSTKRVSCKHLSPRHINFVIGERAHLSGAGRVLCKIGGVPRKKC